MNAPTLILPLRDGGVRNACRDANAVLWQAAAIVPGLELAETGAPAARETHLHVLADCEGLGARFDCTDPHVWNNYEADQEPLYNAEVVEIFLDPHPGDLEYGEFQLSPNNHRFAVWVRNSGGPGWIPEVTGKLDCGALTTSVARTEYGWQGLLFVPWSLLLKTAPPEPGDVWRANFYRIDRLNGADGPGAEDEFSCWVPTRTRPAYFHRPRAFGVLKFEES